MVLGWRSGCGLWRRPTRQLSQLALSYGTQRAFKAVSLAAIASVFLVIGGASQTYSAATQNTGLFMVSLVVAGAGFVVGVHMLRAEFARNGRHATAWSLATGFGPPPFFNKSSLSDRLLARRQGLVTKAKKRTAVLISRGQSPPIDRFAKALALRWRERSGNYTIADRVQYQLREIVEV
jgi:hypothetical protein